MMTPKSTSRVAPIVSVAAIITTVALFRVVRATLLPELPNFSPVMAMAFCSGLFLPGLLAWILPLFVLLVSDIALSFVLSYPAFGAGQFAGWACLVIAVGFGRWLSTVPELKSSVLITVITVNALIFYAVTNAVSWALDPSYPRSWEGLVQALTIGLPGYPPTWVFFRNALVSDFLFVGLIFVVRHLARRPNALGGASYPVSIR